MPRRTIKDADARRREILESARQLFFTKGYAATTINEIIAGTGLSKGGVYHHFASKEDILEALALDLVEQSLARARDVLDDRGLDAVERLNGFLARTRQLKVADAARLRAAFDTVLAPGNSQLYHRLQEAMIEVMLPVMTDIIEEGRRTGRFTVPDAEAAAELVMTLAGGTRRIVARAVAAADSPGLDEAIDALDARLRFQGIALDRILGLPDGTLQLTEPGFLRAALALDDPDRTNGS